MCGPLDALRDPEAVRQFDLLTKWLTTQVPRLIRREVEVLPAGTELFRLTRAPDEEQARAMLGRRPTFFAVTDAEMQQYRSFADLGAKGRLVIIRGKLRQPLHVASADQISITKVIYVGDATETGERVGPFNALRPGPDGSEDGMPVRIQRWVVLVAVGRVLGTPIGGLRRTGVDELTIAAPLNLDLTFDWQEP